MYRDFGKLFCTNAVLAGVASSFVCAEKEVKDVGLNNDLDLETLDVLKTKQEDIEQINKNNLDLKTLNVPKIEQEDVKQINQKVILVYSLVALGVLSLVVVLAIIVRLNYLKNERIEAVDEAWKKANFGGNLRLSTFSENFDKQYMGQSFAEGAEHLKKGANYLFCFLRDNHLSELEFIFASKAEKVYKKILKNLKLVYEEVYVAGNMKIEEVAKEEGWYDDVLELERFGFIFRYLYFGLLEGESSYRTEFSRFQVLLKKLYELNRSDAICELMGFRLKKTGNGVFSLVPTAHASGNFEILGKNGHYGMSHFQKMTGGAIEDKERFENLFGVRKPVTQQ